MTRRLNPAARRELIEIARAIATQQRIDGDPTITSLNGRPLYYDRAGRPIGMGRWAALFGLFSYKVVRQTTLKNGLLVSTVWLGLDHSFTRSKRPTIFETMVFKPAVTSALFGKMAPVRDQVDCCRYETEAEALLGHAEMMEKWAGPIPTQAEASA